MRSWNRVVDLLRPTLRITELYKCVFVFVFVRKQMQTTQLLLRFNMIPVASDSVCMRQEQRKHQHCSFCFVVAVSSARLRFTFSQSQLASLVLPAERYTRCANSLCVCTLCLLRSRETLTQLALRC